MIIFIFFFDEANIIIIMNFKIMNNELDTDFENVADLFYSLPSVLKHNVYVYIEVIHLT